jgi:putative FmdB family regulatory protein
MPLYDFYCSDCGQISEVLISGSNDHPVCGSCGGQNLERRLSAHSSLSGARQPKMPKPGDTGCCGTSIGEAGCAGPGSCCGKQV